MAPRCPRFKNIGLRLKGSATCFYFCSGGVSRKRTSGFRPDIFLCVRGVGTQLDDELYQLPYNEKVENKSRLFIVVAGGGLEPPTYGL